MASLTIRNHDDEMKERLRVRAAQHGQSLEEEAPSSLRSAVGGAAGAEVWRLSRQSFAGARPAGRALVRFAGRHARGDDHRDDRRDRIRRASL